MGTIAAASKMFRGLRERRPRRVPRNPRNQTVSFRNSRETDPPYCAFNETRAPGAGGTRNQEMTMLPIFYRPMVKEALVLIISGVVATVICSRVYAAPASSLCDQPAPVEALAR